MHRFAKQYLSRAAINEIFRYPTIATVCNFISSHILFKGLNQIFYPMLIDSWKSTYVCYNRLPNPNNLRDLDYRHSSHCHPTEYSKFFIQQAAFRE